MPTYLSPGVYVEEAQSGSRSIEGVGTAVVAFVGFADKGPFHEPTLVTNWSQYVQTFVEFVDGTYVGLSVYGYSPTAAASRTSCVSAGPPGTGSRPRAGRPRS